MTVHMRSHWTTFQPLALAATIALLGCSIASRSRPASLESDDAIVYAVVLDSMFRNPSRRERAMMVLLDSTDTYLREELVPEFWTDMYNTPGVDSAAVVDFELRSKRSISLKPAVDTISVRSGWRLELVSSAVLRDIEKTDTTAEAKQLCCAGKYWHAFYLQYPDAVVSVSLSAIGYNREGDAAVLVVEYGCGPLCGGGDIVALRRSSGRWRIVGIFEMWVS